jgi:hypothetical protein
MDFFERFFHVSLDRGNGLAESVFLLIFSALFVLATFPKLCSLAEWALDRLRGTSHEQGETDPHPQT